MSLQALQEYTFKSKYANWVEEKKKRETWPESVDRLMSTFQVKYKDKGIEDIIARVSKAIKKKEILASQRALQFGGEPVLKKNARCYNCVSSYVDRPEFFQQCMYLLLCGCGTGFSVQKHHIAKLPQIHLPLVGLGKKTYIIPDSIEGWSDAIGIIVNSFFVGGDYPEYEGHEIEFDYSLIRPAGSRLSSGSGKAPGPEPLMKAIENIRTVLTNAAKNSNRLKPIEAYDIVMYFANAVVSGGIRRSATICIFSKDDMEMMTAKTGDWYYKNPQRGRSNNSVILLRDKTTKEEFNEVMQYTRQFGEPGFIWADSLEFLCNPCVEIGMWAYLVEDPIKYKKYIEEYGEYATLTCQPEEAGLASGWQGCNLSTENCGKIKTVLDYFRASKRAGEIGTLQSGMTDFPYLGPVTEGIFRREALLGVSMTGIMEAPEIVLNPKIQARAAAIVKKANIKTAARIGINPSARTTCVKPEGTASCVLGTSSGIHPHHAKRYIRRIQANKLESVYNHFRQTNPIACQSSVWSTSDTDDVIAFTVEVKAGAKLKNQVSANDLLDAVITTQKNWVISGTNKHLCTKPWLVHNVSNTITVMDDEWESVTDKIYDNRQYFCGISLLSASGDKDYCQAPFSEIFLPSEMITMYGDAFIFASGLITEAKSLFDDNLWVACDAILGVVKVKGASKISFIERAKKYAMRYLDSDIKKLTYCLKDVDNYKYFVDLQREYKPVDYDLCIEENNDVAPENELACAGGTCSI